MFIINSSLIYNPEDASLEHAYDLIEKMSLSPVQNRTLFFLVENKNILVSKELILDEVWGKHGLTPSMHNLNNVISFLRKSFFNYGIESIIETKVRGGIIFNADVTEINKANSLKNSATSDIKLEKKSSTSLIFLFSSGFLLLCSIISSVYFYKNNYYLNNTNTTTIGLVGSCKIEFISSYYEVDEDDIDVSYLLSISKINLHKICTTPHIIYYYDNYALSPVVQWGTRTSFYYICNNNHTKQPTTNCNNFYVQKN
ncbi:MAG: winged helix-turn-helix domain-containing protein [Klebsiella huaxiensis]|uniref:winged helix-turn-helix domain-containing protein n=1 Tax=Klebsiella huaxiensis TaxID=2153354 RepID=UPI0026E97A1C|nr:winged helix-turn-helix domain-containing protein [Klebsiella huaxiensis]WEJ89511.1 MAG: winged helix-turn-helix domain-containing protein [Klebsiella huaxiensis]